MARDDCLEVVDEVTSTGNSRLEVVAEVAVAEVVADNSSVVAGD